MAKTVIDGIRRPAAAVSMTVLTSQLTSLLALASASLLGVRIADLYALGILVGNASYSGLTIGLLYPYLLGRPNAHKPKFSWFGLTVLGSLFIVGAQVVYLLSSEEFSETGTDDVLIISAFAVGSVVLAASGCYAAPTTLLGNPSALYLVTIAPNLAMFVGCILTASTDLPPNLPALLWCAATGISLLRARHLHGRSLSRSATGGLTPEPSSGRMHIAALTLGIVTSSVLPALYLAALVGADDGSATLAALVTKVGAAIIALTVTSWLTASYRWGLDRRNPKVIVRLGSTVTLGSSTLCLIPIGTSSWIGACAASCWFFGAVTAAISFQEANAKRASRALLVKAVMDIALTVAALPVLERSEDIGAYFFLLAISQAVTIAVCAAVTRDRMSVCVSGGTLFVIFIALFNTIG